MSYEYSEDALIEQATQDVLEELDWEVVTAWKREDLGEHSLLGREHKGEVILGRYVLAALQQFNPDLPAKVYQDALNQLRERAADKTLARINKEKYKLLKEGVPVQFTNADGELVKRKLKVFDFNQITNNHFLAVRQFQVFGDTYNRRPDVVGFVNGIPLLFVELKAHDKDLRNAYEDNLRDYKNTIPQLFYTNAFIILSNGTDARVGTITSPYKYFLEWKRIEEKQEGVVSLDTMLRGTCAPHRFMDIFENFLLFDDAGGDITKLMAKNHQYIGVNKVIENFQQLNELAGKLGVYWHTQGSGKSYSMVFLCEKIHRKLGGGYTFLIVADRTELERQLYDTFSGVGVVNDKNLVAGSKKGSTGRKHLRELLAENHRYVFTLIHKFSIDPTIEAEYPLITERKNIIVISDEAHRTQAGTYAQNMRYKALPNASFLGFTGTPIIKGEEELTKNIFGEYVSVYDFKRAIEDEATLPLRYVNRGELLDIDNPELDERMAEVLEDESLDADQRKKLTYLFQRDYPILTATPRLEAIAKDLVWHFNERGYQGKAMYVALDKPTAVKMYDLIQKHWQPYLVELQAQIDASNDIAEVQTLKRKYKRVQETEVCVVVSDEQNEEEKFDKLGLDIRPHRRKMVERNLEKEFKNPDHPFRLVIVCAMWITGFDAQCVSTVYLDKPIKGHTLMQTIARANRVYDEEKENGLIVDYGNVYKQLEKAYATYGEGGRNGGTADSGEGPVKPLGQIVEELEKAIDTVKAHLESLNYDLERLKNIPAMHKIAELKQAADAVCLNEKTRTTFEVMARNVFRKYKALFPEKEAKPFLATFNAIEAIYKQLNKQVRSADVSDIIQELQALVSESIHLKPQAVNEQSNQEQYINLSSLDFEQLNAAFEKTPRKNTTLFNLKNAIKRKLDKMVKENPLRTNFYEHYQKIIEAYNQGKNYEDTVRAFQQLTELCQDLSQEESRAIKANVNQETLAIIDLLQKDKKLDSKTIKKIKKVAKSILKKLKTQKLKVYRWRESRQLKAQVRQLIHDELLWLPTESFSDNDVNQITSHIYQHIYTNYYGGGQSIYTA